MSNFCGLPVMARRLCQKCFPSDVVVAVVVVLRSVGSTWLLVFRRAFSKLSWLCLSLPNVAHHLIVVVVAYCAESYLCDVVAVVVVAVCKDNKINVLKGLHDTVRHRCLCKRTFAQMFCDNKYNSVWQRQRWLVLRHTPYPQAPSFLSLCLPLFLSTDHSLVQLQSHPTFRWLKLRFAK